MTSGPCKTTHDVKVPFNMPELSSRKMITNSFQVENAQDGTGIGYATIKGHDMMVKLGLKAEFGRQIMEWDKTVIPMMDPEIFLGQT